MSTHTDLGPIEARLRLAAIVDSSEDAIISKDLDGIITSWNAAATQLFGYLPQEIIGKSVLTLIPSDLHGEEPMILSKLRSGERIDHFETRRLTKSGDPLDISLTISPIRNEAGAVIGISKIARDITQRKRTEEALFRSERLAALGRMAAAISHEVNNPLEAVVNLAYLLSKNPSLDTEGREYIDLLLQEVLRISEITKQSLSFYRDTTTETEVEIAPLLESVLQLTTSSLARKSIHVATRLQPGVCVWCRPGEMRQVFTNLILNAIDALPQNGHLLVRNSTVDHGTFVCVTVADNGSGIPAEIREKLFEPFFSTKQATGTGLGLWVSESIVKKYHGSIKMRSAVCAGRSGTVFRICLPARAN